MVLSYRLVQWGSSGGLWYCLALSDAGENVLLPVKIYYRLEGFMMIVIKLFICSLIGYQAFDRRVCQRLFIIS